MTFGLKAVRPAAEGHYMTGVEWREHAELRYLLADYRGASPEQALAFLEEVARIVEAEPEPVHNLTDLRQTETDRVWTSRAKTIAIKVFGPKQTRVAILGAGQVQVLALRGLHRIGQMRHMHTADTVDEALADLASR